MRCCSSGWATSTSCSSRTRSRQHRRWTSRSPSAAAMRARTSRCAACRSHSAEVYLHRLIRKGFRVAICEQLEDPAEARRRPGKALVRRDVVRIVTAGHADRGRACSTRAGATGWWPWPRAAASWVWPGSTSRPGPSPPSRVERGDAAGRAGRAGAGEILVPARLTGRARRPLRARARLPSSRRCRMRASTASRAERRLCAGVRGRHARRARRFRSGGDRGRRRPPRLSRADPERAAAAPRPAAPDRADGRDADRPGDAAQPRAAQRASAATREGSLLAAIDRTVTNAGGRLLAERLAAPLAEPEPIRGRLDEVEAWCSTPDAARRCARPCAAARISAVPSAGWRWRAAARATCSPWRRGCEQAGQLRETDRGRAGAGAIAGRLALDPHDVCAGQLLRSLEPEAPAAGPRRRLRPARAAAPSSTSCAPCATAAAATSRRWRSASGARPGSARSRSATTTCWATSSR